MKARWVAMVGMFVVALALLALSVGIGSLSAAPLAAPTPAVSGYASNVRPQAVEFWSGDALVASGGSDVVNVSQFQTLDVQYVVDHTVVNTTTVKIQFSNDNSNWSDGVNLVASSAADGNGMQQLQVFGIYARMYATLTSADPITWTIKALAK